MSAGVLGAGAALPPTVVTNAALEARLDTTDEWIVRRTGIRERRRLDGTGSLAELAADACRAALADAGMPAERVDRVIVATVTPDRPTPGLAPAVAERLGARRAAASDLNAACAGFLYALDDAAALVDSGRASLVLVCGADALSRLVDADDRATAVLFGDGAGAVLVGRSEFDLGVSPFVLRCDGRGAELLCVDASGHVRMDGKAVYRHAVARMTEAVREALARARISVDELDLLVTHQANARIVEATADALGIPRERAVLALERVANTSAASIPLALVHAEEAGRIPCGATVALAAFGAGFVWGAGVISWKERRLACT